MTGNEMAFPLYDSTSDWAAQGLLKREYFAANIPVLPIEISPEVTQKLLGRKVDLDDAEDMLKASLELEVKIRIMKADILVTELNKHYE